MDLIWLLNKFYSLYVAAIFSIIGRCTTGVAFEYKNIIETKLKQ